MDDEQPQFIHSTLVTEPYDRENLEYELVVRQEPKQARMCGVGGKADRRPIDPPPIVQLRVLDRSTRRERSLGGRRDDAEAGGSRDSSPGPSNGSQSYLQNPYYFMFAALAKPDEDVELHWLKDGKTKCTTGSVVSSLYHLKDAENSNEDAGFFVFPDLSVRTEGSYRLKLSLFEVVGSHVYHCKSIFSAPFYVYTAKKFPGMEESTPLSCSLADQGIKIRIRKDIRVRKRPAQALDAPTPLPMPVPVPLGPVPGTQAPPSNSGGISVGMGPAPVPLGPVPDAPPTAGQTVFPSSSGPPVRLDPPERDDDARRDYERDRERERDRDRDRERDRDKDRDRSDGPERRPSAGDRRPSMRRDSINDRAPKRPRQDDGYVPSDMGESASGAIHASPVSASPQVQPHQPYPHHQQQQTWPPIDPALTAHPAPPPHAPPAHAAHPPADPHAHHYAPYDSRYPPPPPPPAAPGHYPGYEQHAPPPHAGHPSHPSHPPPPAGHQYVAPPAHVQYSHPPPTHGPGPGPAGAPPPPPQYSTYPPPAPVQGAWSAPPPQHQPARYDPYAQHHQAHYPPPPPAHPSQQQHPGQHPPPPPPHAQRYEYAQGYPPPPPPHHQQYSQNGYYEHPPPPPAPGQHPAHPPPHHAPPPPPHAPPHAHQQPHTPHGYAHHGQQQPPSPPPGQVVYDYSQGGYHQPPPPQHRGSYGAPPPPPPQAGPPHPSQQSHYGSYPPPPPSAGASAPGAAQGYHQPARQGSAGSIQASPTQSQSRYQLSTPPGQGGHAPSSGFSGYPVPQATSPSSSALVGGLGIEGAGATTATSAAAVGVHGGPVQSPHGWTPGAPFASAASTALHAASWPVPMPQDQHPYSREYAREPYPHRQDYRGRGIELAPLRSATPPSGGRDIERGGSAKKNPLSIGNIIDE